MSERQRDEQRRSARRRTASAAGVAALALVSAGCSSDTTETSTGTPSPTAGSSASASASKPQPARSQAVVVRNVSARGVPVDKTLTLHAKKGTFESVSVRGRGKALAGALSEDKRTWTATGRLEPGSTYRVTSAAVDADGVKATRHSTFRTQALSLRQQTYPSFAPAPGSTVGVGMPVIVRFDVPVSDRAAIQRHLTVSNTSHQRGAWHWVSASEVHWRPATYWRPGTDVTVTADINSIPAGSGIYGQLSRTTTFHVGRSVVSKVNIDTHQLRTFINGKLARTIPITTGKAGSTTRSGVKVIVEKFRHKRMNSETVGIANDSADGYDLDDVEYAMRLTYSGEFLHAAPWSVAFQGNSNVSHGCTGMSTANAAWLYSQSKPGDVVDYTGSDRPMTLDNGFGDWNASFASYKQASAL